MRLLRADSSARRNSVSRRLTGRFVETWQAEHPDGEVVESDLAADPSSCRQLPQFRFAMIWLM